MVRLLCCVFSFLILSGCLVPADTVVNIEGVVVDEAGRHYEKCKYSLVEKDRELFSVLSSGEFRHSAVLGGFNYNKARLKVECKGGGRSEKVRLPEVPQNITDYMSFGTLVIERKTGE